MKPSDVIPFPRRPDARRRDELEFLPAALEIIETPVSPAGRAVAATIILFFCLALAWACLGRIDIIATAQGRIVPTGRTKVIQPFESGIVRTIHVRDGDKVEAGQVLVELDATVATAERNRIGVDLLQARLDAARLTALRAGLAGDLTPAGFTPPEGAPAHQAERTRAMMLSQAEQQRAKVAAVDQQIAQKQAEAASLAAAIEKIEAVLPLVEETAEVRHKAMLLEYGNRIAHLDAQLRLTDQRHELILQQRRVAEVLAARRSLERQREQAQAEYAQTIVADLAEAEQKASGLAEELVKAEKRIRDQVLTAPIAGTVQQRAVHTEGGVVTPAQQLMVIVPADSRLEAEAMIANKDIGFVQAGQVAEIKVDTFNFTKYGLIAGEVVNVSQDAITREKPPGSDPTRSRGALSETSEPQGQELVYSARVSLARTVMQIEDKRVALAPGMAVTVDIKTGQRRVIEYLLSPLLRYGHEAGRER